MLFELFVKSYQKITHLICQKGDITHTWGKMIQKKGDLKKTSL